MSLFTIFLIICALPVLIVLFLIGLRILMEVVPILLAAAAIAAVILVALSLLIMPSDHGIGLPMRATLDDVR